MRFSPPLLAPWVYPVALIAAALAATAAVLFGELKVKDLLTPLLAIFATFFGATFAFRLNEAKELRALSNSRREALNRALFTLIRQANAVRQLTRDFQKYSSQFERAFNMPAYSPPTYADLTFDFSELDFLLDSSKPSILFALSIEEERFHQMISAIQIRNEFYVGEVQKAMAVHQVNGKKITAAKLEALLGERLFHGAVRGAEEAWQHVIKTDSSLPEIYEELRQLAKEIYPAHRFIDYEKVELATSPVETSKSIESFPADYRWKW